MICVLKMNSQIGQLIQNDFDAEKTDKNYTFASNKIANRINSYITPIPLSRIAFAENKLDALAQHCGKCQYLICGAGMDTFAFRNDNPDIKVFELDYPDTGRYKRRRIRELEWIIPDNLTFVPIDFSKDDMSERLLVSGYDPETPKIPSTKRIELFSPARSPLPTMLRWWKR